MKYFRIYKCSMIECVNIFTLIKFIADVKVEKMLSVLQEVINMQSAFQEYFSM